MSLSVKRALDYLSKGRLKEICREQELKVSGHKPDLIARLARACRSDLTSLLDHLNGYDLLDIAGHFDDQTIRRFVLTAAKRGRGIEGARRQGDEIKVFSTSRIGGVARLDVPAIAVDGRRAVRTTVVSAYDVAELLEELLVDCGDVRVVTNGLGGRRLEEQLLELDALSKQLGERNRSAEVRLAFSRGIFHSKLYVFEGEEGHVVAWIGSANATSAALNGHNEEVLLRLDPAPPPVVDYANGVCDSSSELDDCRPDIDSLAAFFRTGDIYYRPYTHLRVTVNPFTPLLDQLPQVEREKLSPFSSEYAEADAGIGAFNVRLVYEGTGGRAVDLTSRRQARIRPYAVETCYGYWVPEPSIDAVDRIISGASAQKEEFLASFLEWLEGEGLEQTFSAFDGYLADARRVVREHDVDWETYAPQYGYVFESSDGIEKCVAELVGQLRHPVDRAKHSHAFVTARLPEIWDDAVARGHFERTFFESLEAQSSRRSHKWVSARWIL